jgi:hypothetical protein
MPFLREKARVLLEKDKIKELKNRIGPVNNPIGCHASYFVQKDIRYLYTCKVKRMNLHEYSNMQIEVEFS